MRVEGPMERPDMRAEDVIALTGVVVFVSFLHSARTPDDNSPSHTIAGTASDAARSRWWESGLLRAGHASPPKRKGRSLGRRTHLRDLWCRQSISPATVETVKKENGRMGKGRVDCNERLLQATRGSNWLALRVQGNKKRQGASQNRVFVFIWARTGTRKLREGPFSYQILARTLIAVHVRDSFGCTRDRAGRERGWSLLLAGGGVGDRSQHRAGEHNEHGRGVRERRDEAGVGGFWK